MARLKNIPLYIIWCTLALCYGCSGLHTATSETDADSLLHYATLLHLSETDSATVCEIKNPWREGALLHRYILVPSGQKVPDNIPQGTLVRTPLTRAVSFTSVHAALLADLGVMDRLYGMCDTAYVIRQDLRDALRAGSLNDMGSSQTPNREKLVAAKTDALLVSPFENAGYGGIEQLNIPLIECADYMETSPLARAEWMCFYGRLFGCAARADSLFAVVEKNYLNLKERAQATKERPTVNTDHMQSGVWYVPGGNSTMGRLFADAGADYVFSDNAQSGSVALNFEAVFAKGRTADFWLTKYGAAKDLTYKTLAEEYAGYGKFDAWQQHHVYQCNVSHTPFFEDTPFHPDRLLADIIRIVHPELLPDAKPLYYTPMRP